MPGKTRYELLKDLLEPFIGRKLHVDKLRLLLIRNMGTSGSSITSYLKFAQDAKLIQEREPFQFEVLEIKEL